MFRQGDVLIVPVNRIPLEYKRQPRAQGRVVLAYGEVTGHAHAISELGAELYGSDLEARFLEVLAEGGVALTHEEHATIIIPPGLYQVVRQREYSPESDNFVAD